MNRPRHSKLFLIFSLIMIICMVSVQNIYKDPPPYFNAFYCNLGTKTVTQNVSYDYFCTSPKVIQRADNFALALVEINK